ncbi:AMP-binding protein [Nonomuraea recticatena]|uniref:AMP-binding protein n=1 Tax=Nonomuraea recticatena TaxID=46178 RepID=UPI003618AB67
MNEKYSSLTSVFHDHVRCRPRAVAVVDESRTVSYAELAAASYDVRRSLARLGIRPGDRVGVYMRRSWRVVAAIIAVIDHGCTYVPLDPDYPAARVRFMAEDSGVRAICADPGTPWPFEGTAEIQVTGAEAEPVPSAERAADVPTHIIYTSGSTGTPKGVATPEHAVQELFRSAAERFSFSTADAWSWFHSHCFDFSVWEIWGALLHGGCIVVIGTEVGRDPWRLLDTLADQGVTVLCQVPSMFKYLTAALVDKPRPWPCATSSWAARRSITTPSGRGWTSAPGRAGTSPWSTSTARPRPPSSPPARWSTG